MGGPALAVAPGVAGSVAGLVGGLVPVLLLDWYRVEFLTLLGWELPQDLVLDTDGVVLVTVAMMIGIMIIYQKMVIFLL